MLCPLSLPSSVIVLYSLYWSRALSSSPPHLYVSHMMPSSSFSAALLFLYSPLSLSSEFSLRAEEPSSSYDLALSLPFILLCYLYPSCCIPSFCAALPAPLPLLSLSLSLPSLSPFFLLYCSLVFVLSILLQYSLPPLMYLSYPSSPSTPSSLLFLCFFFLNFLYCFLAPCLPCSLPTLPCLSPPPIPPPPLFN